jgi:hypothetical protein
VARPKDDWLVEERPDLAILDGELWARVHARLQAVREAYGSATQNKRPRGQAPEVYSRHLLSGLMRCAICGARITIQSSQREKNGTVYRYGRYRCSFHVTKGPAVCANAMSIPQQALEAKLLAKFQAALSGDMMDYLVVATNELLRQLHGTTPQEIHTLAQERREVERQLSNLVEFVAKGDVSSPRLRDEIRAREQRLAELDQQLEGLRTTTRPVPRQIDRAWVEAKIQSLSELLTRDPVGARQQIQKHVEELRVAPAPDVGDRVVRITGRATLDGLLATEEAVRLQLVAGAGFEPATFGL